MKTMEPTVGAERECTLLGTLFQYIITDLKSSSPAWDDMVSKGFKLHNLLKTTTTAMTGFVEAIQKIADSATHSKGSTKDVGTALTRICVRQKMVENKLKQFTNALLDNFLNPVQERVEDWKKTTIQLEKDHTKEYKRATSEIKKRNSDTMRLQKKAKKASKGDVQFQINAVMCDVNERFTALEETEKVALRNLLVEERSRICQFANYLAPVLDMQASLLNEGDHLRDLNSDMESLCRNPMQLPTSTEQLIQDFISANDHLAPPPEVHAFHHSASDNNVDLLSSSPDLIDNRKFSSFSANTESSFRSKTSLNRSATLRHRHNRPNQSQQKHRRTSSGGNYVINTDEPELPISSYERLSSVSSRDSGFVSAPVWERETAIMTSRHASGTHQTFKNPFSTDQGSYKDDDSSVDSTPPTPPQRRDSRPSPEKQFSWKDWKIPGPYEINSIVPASMDVHPSSKPAPPTISPKPVNYHQQQLPTEPPQEQVPPRPSAVNKSRFCYALPPTTQVSPSNQTATDPTDDPLPPPPPSLLEDSVADSIVQATREISIQPDSSYSQIHAARDPSHQFSHQTYTHDDYRRASSPHIPSSNYFNSNYAQVNAARVSSPQRSIPGYGNRARASSPQLQVPSYIQGDIGSPRHEVGRAPSPQLTVPNYMQGGVDYHAMTLGRKNSNNSLHHSTSSGYSSQHTTPACSEDTIASHESDPSSLENEEVPHLRSRYDYEKYSTLPRNYHHGRSMEQSNRGSQKRIVTPAEMPVPAYSTSSNDISRIATIRRKPSARFSSSSTRASRTPNVPTGGAVANLLSTFVAPQRDTVNY